MHWSTALVGVILLLVSPSFAGEVKGRVVNGKGEGVAQAVVFVSELPPGVVPNSQPRSAIMDQIHKQYVPHILPVVVGTEVHFPFEVRYSLDTGLLSASFISEVRSQNWTFAVVQMTLRFDDPLTR